MGRRGGWKTGDRRYKEGRVEIRRGGEGESAGVREGQINRYVGKVKADLQKWDGDEV